PVCPCALSHCPCARVPSIGSMAAFDVQLPFSVRPSRLDRMTLGELRQYRKLATSTPPLLQGIKGKLMSCNVSCQAISQALRAADTGSGSIVYTDWLTGLQRAGVDISASEAKALHNAFRSNVGVDIEMFCQILTHWRATEPASAGQPPAPPFAVTPEVISPASRSTSPVKTVRPQAWGEG
ncbi:unnamed protein product, partial [Chrysoparadoxa australica]